MTVQGNRPARRSFAALTSNFDKRMFAYAAAATAAGVGLLAQSAEARIVYTPANIPVPADGGLVQIDINHDGVPDFGFYNFAYPAAFGRNPEGFHQYSFRVTGSQTEDQVWDVGKKAGCAAVLPKGVSVGAGKNFQAAGSLFASAGSYTNGGGGDACKWGAAHHGAFLGLKFVVSGQTYYGWAHVTVPASGSPVINGYAYETVANKPILTGAANGPAEQATATAPTLSPSVQPASLAWLARGSDSLAVWRRPEKPQPASV